MVRAGALLYVIGLSFIIFLILSSLTLADYYSRISLAQSLEHERLQRNCVSGINLLLSDPLACPLNADAKIDLFSTGNDTVKLERRTWGLFELIVSSASSKRGHWSKMAFTGNPLPKDTALYLADRDRALSLCGNTHIKGVAVLPRLGAKRAYIEGKNFTGRNLIDGTTKVSERFLPAMNDTLFLHMIAMLKDGPLQYDSLIRLDTYAIPDSLTHDFIRKTVCYFSPAPIIIENTVLTGNIMIISKAKIIVRNTAIMNDVIIIGPRVSFEDGFYGSVQVIASDTIITGKKCEFLYPSVLCVVREKNRSISSLVQLGEESTLSGALLAWEEQYDIRSQVRINIEKEVHVSGLVYSNGSVDHKGSLKGCMIVNVIILKTPSSFYDNHLLDAEIDATGISPYFLVPPVLASPGSKSVLKWLQ